ncbi:MAG TPA: aldo/keto reductase [Nitrososphaerales archaeon]|nr:aldo/keto reductase [Nitrososphaerales archaeon]
MEYRQLGQTGEKVSVVGMGCWGIGLSKNRGDWAGEVASLRRGVELGMNLIDTAERYSSGRSEELVGEAIRDCRDDVFVATKVAPPNLRHDAVIKACKDSIRRLGVSCVDLYQIHWPDPAVPIKETMSAMERLVQDGLVRYIGVSNFSVSETDDARAALAKNEIASNQVEYALTNRSVEADILPYCVREKITLIAYSPLAHGRLARSIPNYILQKYNMTPAQAMLNWVTRDEQVVAIPKSGNIKHQEENASSIAVRFSPRDYEKMP